MGGASETAVCSACQSSTTHIYGKCVRARIAQQSTNLFEMFLRVPIAAHVALHFYAIENRRSVFQMVASEIDASRSDIVWIR